MGNNCGVVATLLCGFSVPRLCWGIKTLFKMCAVGASGLRLLFMIKAWIDKNLVGCADPRQHGKALTANHSGHWRYRIGDYRLICIIEDDRLVIIALDIGHRSEIYK